MSKDKLNPRMLKMMREIMSHGVIDLEKISNVLVELSSKIDNLEAKVLSLTKNEVIPRTGGNSLDSYTYRARSLEINEERCQTCGGIFVKKGPDHHYCEECPPF